MFTHLQKFVSNNIARFKSSRSVSLKTAILVFLLSLSSIIVLLRRLERDRLMVERYRAASVANTYTADIQRDIEQALSVTYAISTLVREYRGIMPHFETVGKDLLSLYPGADALALLPDKIVPQSLVTKHGKTIVSQEHLQQLRERKPNLVGQTEELSLNPHFPLNRNLSGAVGYLPIFLEDERGNKYFWGFTTVTIDLPEVLQKLHLKQLEERGFAYRLRSFNSEAPNQKSQRQATFLEIAKSLAPLRDRPVENTVEIANTSWTLSLTPIMGWHQPLKFWSKFLLGGLFSFILGVAVKLFLDSKVSALELDKIAYFDPLTTLPNRRFLLYRLEQIIAHTKRNEKNMAICYLDLDDFKTINQSLGNKAGDYILVRIAKRLQKFLRLDDVIARVGGDEFVIVLQDLSHIEEAELVLERILEAVASPITLDFDAQTIAVSTSIGVTMYSQGDRSMEALLSYAEQSMSYTKEHNRGSYTLFHQIEKNTAPSSSTSL